VDEDAARLVAVTTKDGQAFIIGIETTPARLETTAATILEPVTMSIRFLD